MGFSGGSDGKEFACNVRDHTSILAWRIPWTGKTGGLYSPWGHKELDATERLTLSLLVQWLRIHLPMQGTQV